VSLFVPVSRSLLDGEQFCTSGHGGGSVDRVFRDKFHLFFSFFRHYSRHTVQANLRLSADLYYFFTCFSPTRTIDPTESLSTFSPCALYVILPFPFATQITGQQMAPVSHRSILKSPGQSAAQSSPVNPILGVKSSPCQSDSGRGFFVFHLLLDALFSGSSNYPI
jgi:hypothetical protein